MYDHLPYVFQWEVGERGGSVVECRTPEREVRGSRPTAAVLCPWARHFTPRKYWLITQEAMAPSRHDWKIVDWDVKPQHNQPNFSEKFLVCPMKHAAVSMDIEGNHELIPLDEDVSWLQQKWDCFEFWFFDSTKNKSEVWEHSKNLVIILKLEQCYITFKTIMCPKDVEELQTV